MHFTKTLLVMKFTVFFLLAGMLQVSARTHAQTVTYTGRSVPLTAVFSAFKEQTGYLFFYRKEDLSGAVPVTLQLRKVPLQTALEQALADQPLIFQIQGNTIFITLKPPPAPITEEAATPSAVINGRVQDSLGTPLSGASVMVKGSRRGTTTDARGDFGIKGVGEDVTLVISFTGYVTKEYKVKEFNNKFFVILSRSNSPLDDVQVVAYGTNTRRFNVGSVSVVTSEDIQRQPVTNLMLALQGRVPGLTVDPSSGIPGSRVNLQVRGQNTLLSILGDREPFDEPLYIVDGVPFASQNRNLSGMIATFSGTNTTPTSPGISGLNALNPSDIESISVLKDADATSIYGSQGANGVIVITTKKGKAGASNLGLRVNTGPNKIARQLEMLNTQQYLAMRRQALANDGMTPDMDPSQFPDLLVYDTTKYTNWAKKFFGGTSNNTDAYASLSGGTQYTTFLVSAGFTRSVYNFPGNFSDQRLTLHSGFHHSSLNHRLNIDFGSDLSYDRNNSSSAPDITQALRLSPNHPDMTDAAGKLVWDYKGVNVGNDQMMAYLQRPFSLQSYTSNNSLRVSYQVMTGLNVGIGLGYSLINTKEFAANPLGTQDPHNYPYSSANFGRSDFQTVNVEPQIDYRRTIGKGVLTALAGGTYKKRTSSNDQMQGNGFPDDALLHSIEAAQTISGSNTYSIYKYAGAFGRLGFIYDKEYIINFTGRRDGSSNFGPGHQWGNFGSVGLGWIFSEEEVFKRTLSFISYAKVSGNYGTNGSDGVAPYRYQPFWRAGNPYVFPLFQGTRSYIPSNLYNPSYGWASKHALNLSLDLGFLQDRLLTNVTWYRNRTGNQLTSSPLPGQTGFTSVVENFQATLQDAGWEFSISSVNIKTRDFRWSTNFNISANRNKLLAFPNIDKSVYATIYTVGKSTSLTYGFNYKGVNDTTGIFEYYTGKGGVGSTSMKYTRAGLGGDMVPIADPQPKYFGGIGNTLTYKGWSVSLFFNFMKRTARNYLAGVYGGNLPGNMSNLPTVLSGKFWEKEGDKALLQRFTTGSYLANASGSNAMRAAQYFGTSSAVWGDASFIRLKTVSVSYSLPADRLKKIGLKGCNIYVNAQNLFTITGYKVGDPETPGSLYAVPLQRTVVGGLSFDF
jgi:TonB-linked SusC/RagA family outer membrane protein